MTYAYAKPGGMANSARSTGSKDESQTVNAFDFEFRRWPGIWSARKVLEKKDNCEIVDTASVFVKGDGNGVLFTAARWRRENGEAAGRLQWNVFLHFSMSLFTTFARLEKVESDFEKKESEWKAKYGMENRYNLEREMNKLLAEQLMQDDIKKVRRKRELEQSKRETGLGLHHEVRRALKEGALTEADLAMLQELRKSIATLPYRTDQWRSMIEKVADYVEKTYSYDAPTSPGGVRICLNALLGPECSKLVAEEVYQRLIIRRSLGTSIPTQA